jgi:hypothetical protein
VARLENRQDKMVRIMFEVFVTLVAAAVAIEFAVLLRRVWQHLKRRQQE